MTNYREHYKEIEPMETVERIKQILKKVGIDVEEDWHEISEIGTYTVRLTIKGTSIGTNGKGVSREFAMASAYAEFMERLENDLLWGSQWYQGLNDFCDSKIMSAEELINADSAFIKKYFENRGLEKASKRKKTNHLKNMEILQKEISDDEDKYTVVPFFNLSKKQVEYMPFSIYPLYYGSNGMCAGNTQEEAIVQGLSEIFERFVQTKCFQEQICFPDIPDEDIKKYPYVWEMFEKVRNMDGIKAWMKDCSTGGKYPVAALLVQYENSGKYGIKFGCHPIMGIAMERTLTEATQGQKVVGFATSSQFDFFNAGICERYNIENTMKVGIGQYPHQLFDEEPTYEYTRYKDFSGYSNKEILSAWLNELIANGHDVLIRNASYLGFHAYHIIIPGVSEIRENSDAFSRKYNTRLYASYLLSDIKNVNLENLKYIVGAVEAYMLCINENRLYSLFSPNVEQKLPGYEIREENELFCCFALVALKKYEKAYTYIGCVIKKAIKEKDCHLPFYVAVKNYIAGMMKYENHKKVIFYISTLFDEKVTNYIDDTFIENEKVIEKVYGKYCIKEQDQAMDFDFLKTLKRMKNENYPNQSQLSALLSA